MKPLLNSITRPFLTYVLIVFVISIPVYFFAIDTIWKSELDEHNRIIADKTAYGVNRLKLSDDQLQNSIALWNSVQPGTDIEPVKYGDQLKDSVYTVDKQKFYEAGRNIDRFRCLSTVIYLNEKPYRFTAETNIEESQETIAVIAATTIFFFLVIVVGLLVLNRRLSSVVWKPFRENLEKLKTFNLNNQKEIDFASSDITEFEELTESMRRLIKQNISVFRIQKEFTENASHEMQTPLAILRNKLDNLLQDKDLTDTQYQIVEEMHTALTRSSRINRNLLLLAKIGNSQFDNSELVRFDILVQQSVGVLEEHFQQKNISVAMNELLQVEVSGNSGLTETLINNLLLNAIRHTPSGGSISIILENIGFEVRNSGAGPLSRELLFQRFSKLSTGSSGSGLGLAIVKEICTFQKWSVHYSFEKEHHVFRVDF
ncbi:sensor histidine kinase [Niabella beijingensis]|uniref:sensor histidine kinase n=1 Tax=Niabella beijingensis TaxID=2872700 RepID=UPI001CC0D627|nr:HAMP domain-containing sensor histidine kinase [Niabella beijingensis]MBZ4192428.1 HAMP domain-containing histidine kinase [Niabella beijingensis]